MNAASESDRLDDIISFVSNCCSEKFSRLLKSIFNLSSATQTFQAAWEEAVSVPVFKMQ
jgi:hypothetical protein